MTELFTERRGTPAPPRAGPRAAAEIAVLFALLIAIDIGFVGGARFAGINPSPYWIPVLLGASLYGTGIGLLAATIASLLYLSGSLPPLAAGGDYFRHGVAIALPPMLWGLAAVAIGEISLARRRAVATAERRADRLAGEVDTLSRRIRDLDNNYQQLQISHAGLTDTRMAAYGNAVSLADPDPAIFWPAVGQLIRGVTGADAFTLYSIVAGRLEPIVRWRTRPDGESTSPPGPALTAALIAGDRWLTAESAADRALLGKAGLIAGPIRAGGGRVRAVLVIETLPFARLNRLMLANTETMATWIAALLDRHRLPRPDIRSAPHDAVAARRAAR